jgi:hypothetical protein
MRASRSTSWLAGALADVDTASVLHTGELSANAYAQAREAPFAAARPTLGAALGALPINRHSTRSFKPSLIKTALRWKALPALRSRERLHQQDVGAAYFCRWLSDAACRLKTTIQMDIAPVAGNK